MTTTSTTQPAPAALPDGVEFLYMNPADLIVDANIRTDAAITPEFRQSIRDLGVRVPVTAVRAPEGIKVREGQRRTITATQEQVPAIPVYVVPDGGDVERIIGQLAENHDRAAMTQPDTAAAYEQLALLGLSASQIAKRPRRTKAEVTAGLTVAKSTTAAEAAEGYALDLVSAALFAEFDGDEDATRTLRWAAERGGSLAHAAQRIRDERARTQALDTERARLTADGVTITPKPGYYEVTPRREVTALRAKGHTEPLTPEQHATCPHHAAYVHYDDATATAEAVYICTDYKAAGHLRWTDPAAKAERTPVSEAERAERRQVRENNAAWRSAEKVRRDWLAATIARRKTPPKGAAELVADAIVNQASRLSYAADRGFQVAASLLGHTGEYGGRQYIANLLSKANTPRSHVITLVVVLAAIEECTGVHSWRNASGDSGAADYLTTLETWGYQLSDIEQVACGRTPATDPDPEPAEAAAPAA